MQAEESVRSRGQRTDRTSESPGRKKEHQEAGVKT